MLAIILTVAGLAIPPTHTLAQDRELFADKRPVFLQLALAIRDCGKIPVMHLPFGAHYGNQVCPNGGQAAAMRIPPLVNEIGALDADYENVDFGDGSMPAVKINTGAIGLGIESGSSVSSIYYFISRLPRPTIGLTPLESPPGHWYQFIDSDDSER